MKCSSWTRGILLPLIIVIVIGELALVAPAQAAAANPILIVTSSSNPYTTFLPEILRTEGFNEFDTADISVVTSTTLSAYDLVVLGDMSLTAAQVTMFTNWVNGGGNLIAMHPDPQLAGLLGLVDTGTALSNAYVLMNTSAGPGVGLVGQTIQFHGPAELYTLNGATSYATLYSNASTPTSNPALTLNAGRIRAGGGVHLRPGALGCLYPPGQSRLERTGTRCRQRSSHPLLQLVLRRRILRPRARLGRFQQDPNTAGG